MSTTLPTATGQQADLLYLQPGHICIADVAHALAQINLFTGHARRPYSAAEHSLLVLEIVEREIAHVDVHGRMAALMHHAHKAYTGDVSPPVRALCSQTWDLLEGRVQRTARSAFGLHAAATLHSATICRAERMAQATARAQLLPAGAPLCPELLHVQPVPWVDLMAPERVAMSWAQWRDQFTWTYEGIEAAIGAVLFPVLQP